MKKDKVILNFVENYLCNDCGVNTELSKYLMQIPSAIQPFFITLCTSCVEKREFESENFKFSELSDKAKSNAIFGYNTECEETEPPSHDETWQIHLDNEDEWFFDEYGDKQEM